MKHGTHRKNVVVIGASAGGVDTLLKLLRLLPADLPASLFVALHIGPGPSSLASIFSSVCALPVANAQDGERIEIGRIYLAPPNVHLLVEKDRVRLDKGPKEHYHRPSIDALFRSASSAYEKRVVGIILSGTLDDGSGGMVTIKRRGGTAIVQDPAEALFPEMPHNVMEATDVDHIFTVQQLAENLPRIVREEIPMEGGAGMGSRNQLGDYKMSQEEKPRGSPSGPPTPYVCPDCGGSLWEREDDGHLEFRCHVGHVYSPQSLVAQNLEAVEGALWTALRILEERVGLCRRLANRSEEKGFSAAARFEEEAGIAERRADILRQVLRHGRLLE